MGLLFPCPASPLIFSVELGEPEIPAPINFLVEYGELFRTGTKPPSRAVRPAPFRFSRTQKLEIVGFSFVVIWQVPLQEFSRRTSPSWSPREMGTGRCYGPSLQNYLLLVALWCQVFNTLMLTFPEQ